LATNQGVRSSNLFGRATFIISSIYAPVAQLDRVLGFEPRGQEFESLRARHFNKKAKQEALKNSEKKYDLAVKIGKKHINKLKIKKD
jgi:hypothetical protein